MSRQGKLIEDKTSETVRDVSEHKKRSLCKSDNLSLIFRNHVKEDREPISQTVPWPPLLCHSIHKPSQPYHTKADK